MKTSKLDLRLACETRFLRAIVATITETRSPMQLGRSYLLAAILKLADLVGKVVTCIAQRCLPVSFLVRDSLLARSASPRLLLVVALVADSREPSQRACGDPLLAVVALFLALVVTLVAQAGAVAERPCWHVRAAALAGLLASVVARVAHAGAPFPLIPVKRCLAKVTILRHAVVASVAHACLPVQLMVHEAGVAEFAALLGGSVALVAQARVPVQHLQRQPTLADLARLVCRIVAAVAQFRAVRFLPRVQRGATVLALYPPRENV